MRLLALAVVTTLGVLAAHAQLGRWVKLAPFPEPAEDLYGVAAGDRLYVLGSRATGWPGL